MIRAAIRAAIAAVLSSAVRRSQYTGQTLDLDFTTETYRIEV
jgi:hypothetical protein